VPSFDVLTFDCYGTLVDWETGIAEAFLHTGREEGMRLDREAVLRAYANIEPEVQTERYRPYREVLTLAAAKTARRVGWPLSQERASFLAESLPRWPPFPDTNAALELLAAAGITLGILSNVDEDLLAGTLRHFTVEFGFCVTAEQVRAYKPAVDHFERARVLVGERRWLHVAQSYFHDVEPACTMGIPVVWVNRKREQPSGIARPATQVADLARLVDWLKL
jgi:2-haloacid dehalogenase/putative hydrolase of the HAD superfamily